MRNLNSLCFLVLSFIIIGCDNETEEPAAITVTPPATYSFERNGASTVSYSGQSARLEMAAELGTGLNTPTKTAIELNAMFNDGTGFGNSALDESGKKLGNKTASSSQASSTVKPQFDALITDVTSNVFPNVANTASDGTPELILILEGEQLLLMVKGMKLINYL